jgi:hypothetical protein
VDPKPDHGCKEYAFIHVLFGPEGIPLVKKDLKEELEL